MIHDETNENTQWGEKNFLLNAMFKTYLNGLKANHTCDICGVTSVSRILV